jgi:hypothetical protein
MTKPKYPLATINALVLIHKPDEEALLKLLTERGWTYDQYRKATKRSNTRRAVKITQKNTLSRDV